MSDLFLGWLIFVAGVVIGINARKAWGDARYGIAKGDFADVLAEKETEIKRLREFMARHVGKES